MNVDEIVKKLRLRANMFSTTPECDKTLMEEAASLIESMQAQFSASQRREKAAVDICDGCNFKNTVGCHCARAAWRSPQEAGDE